MALGLGGRRTIYLSFTPEVVREPTVTVKNYDCLLLIGAAGNLTPIRSKQHNVNHWKKSDTGHTGGESRSSYREI